MNKKTWTNTTLLILSIVVGGLIILLDSVLDIGKSDTLLFTLVYWVMIIEGCIAFAAAVESSESQWLNPIKSNLLSVYPLLLFFAVLFIFLSPKMHFYPWLSINGLWLNKNAFIARNVLILLLAYFIARMYALESLKNGKNRKVYAVIYLFVFVLSQSMIAFDWVMSLEYPWVSTLYGGFYFIESLYTGIAVAVIILFAKSKSMSPDAFTPYKKTLNDAALMMFGISMLWGGLFYSQFLVIWYGHLPEESSFFVRRMAQAPYRQMMISVVPLLFGVPFIVLLSKSIKTKPYGMLFVAIVVLVGIFVERLVMILPLAPIHSYLAILEFAGMAFLTGVFIMHREC